MFVGLLLTGKTMPHNVCCSVDLQLAEVEPVYTRQCHEAQSLECKAHILLFQTLYYSKTRY